MFSGTQSFGGAVSDAFGSTLGGPTQAAAQETAAKKVRQEDKQTCLPVTVRLIERAVEQREDAASEGLRFHGTEHGVLILVGLIETLVRQPASIECTISDGTGRIKARFYSSSEHLRDLEPGRYVSLFGHVRTAPALHFAVVGMWAVDSADDVSFHMIEVAHAALKLGRGAADLTTPPPKKPVAKTAGLPEPAAAGFEVAALEVSPAKAAPLAGKPLRAAILRFLQAEGEARPEGLDLAAVCAHLGPAPANEVSKMLESLVNDGDVFTTIDDEHFQCV
uniref:Replication protein A C-terminal domain-containing protein n=1 Tax=Alexandrium monilatum TaxID=311494 RepID=A0A7S4RRX6_9DINO